MIEDKVTEEEGGEITCQSNISPKWQELGFEDRGMYAYETFISFAVSLIFHPLFFVFALATCLDH